MSSTTAVLNACQARNDSGSLSSILTGSVTVRFYEETATPLSDRDRDRFLDLLDNPPGPNEALKRAAQKHAKPHG